MNTFSGRFLSRLPLLLLLWLYFLVPVFFQPLMGIRGFLFLVLFQPFAVALVLTLAASLRRWIHAVVLTLCSLIFFGELFCLFAQGDRISSPMMVIALQTNPGEAGEFLSMSVGPLLGALGVMAVVIGAYLVLSAMWRRFIERRISRMPRVVGVAFAACLLAGVCLSVYDMVRVSRTSFREFWMRQCALETASAPMVYYYAVKDIRVMFDPARYDRLERAIAAEDVHAADPGEDITVVYIIGESFIKSRSEIYGYFLPTTPVADSLRREGRLIAFSNVITPANFTIDAYRLLHSLHDAGSEDVYEDSPLLAAVMKKAGFSTAMYDNQSLRTEPGRFDFGTTAFMNKRTIFEACFDRTSDTLCDYDLDFIRLYSVSPSRGRDFVVYHHMGQHFEFDERYPASDAVFTPDNYVHIPGLDATARGYMAAYDNALLHGDKVLASVIDRLTDVNAVVVYVPDHGEELYDFRIHKGREVNSREPGVVKVNYEVPLFIWVSPEYASRHPERVEAMRQCEDKPVYNSDVTHTILDLAGVECGSYMPALSLLRPDTARTASRRLYGSGYDYDRNRTAIDSVKLLYCR